MRLKNKSVKIRVFAKANPFHLRPIYRKTIMKLKLLFTTAFFCCAFANAQKAKTFYKHDKYLSSDRLEGRFVGTKGNNDAAAYIKKYFMKYGLTQFNGTYYQPFKVFVKEGINKMKSDSVATQNLVGYIEGSDPTLKNEYIVIGAHYDHWGWGGQGSGSKKKEAFAIHNGADDNASGVSALLCILEEISKQKVNQSEASFLFRLAEKKKDCWAQNILSIICQFQKKR